MNTGKAIALTKRTFAGKKKKKKSLLFNMLSSLVMVFLPRRVFFCFLISWLQSPSAVIFEPPKIKQDDKKGEIAFRIKPQTCQRCSEGSNKTLHVPGYPTETESDLPLSV